MRRSSLLPLVLLTAASPACGGTSEDEASNLRAQLTEIGSLGEPIPNYEMLSPTAGIQRFYADFLEAYEPTGRWALLRYSVTDTEVVFRGSNEVRHWIVDLQTGELRQTCPEVDPFAFLSQRTLETNASLSRVRLFRVTDEGVFEAMTNTGVLRCELGADIDTPGAMLETLPWPVSSVNDNGYNLVFDEGMWISPHSGYTYAGSELTGDWPDSYWDYRVNRLGDRMLVAVNETATGDVVGYEMDATGAKVEIGRVPGGSVHVVDLDMIQVNTPTGTCALIRSGETAANEVAAPCGGRLSWDGLSYVVDKSWVMLDGSAAMDHPQANDYYLTGFGTVLHIGGTAEEMRIWTAPIDEAPVPDPEPDFVLDCIERFSSACTTTPEVREYANGVCLLMPEASAGSTAYPYLAFDCRDASKNSVLATTDGTDWYNYIPDPNASSYEAPLVLDWTTREDDYEPRITPNAYLLQPDFSEYWIADDRVHELDPRTGPTTDTFENTLAVGYDGTLYRVDMIP